ncbi:MAG: bifunctional phosphoribosylaminoimidazolecarboxamide formyltransferase/IMP cyclohydrolase [Actinobacteria bacterium]|nr:bifunctional phosphoribosylaminoimidazolecarboxamide formyltransferase/IMP cyclohydrolase [Actinomycetota bacterium]
MTALFSIILSADLIKMKDRMKKEPGYMFGHKIDCTKVENEYIGSSGMNNFRDAEGKFNSDLNLVFEKVQDLRYGENPHQKAAYYRFRNCRPECFANSIQLQGKELSYNNLLDANSAFSIVKEFETPCVSIIKHNNPCGVATAITVTEAYHNAHFCDPASAFGGIVACNYKWTSDAARFMSDKFIEVLIAPEFEAEALEILAGRESLRVLKINFNLKKHIEKLALKNMEKASHDIKGVDGGLLVQESDESLQSQIKFEIVTEARPGRNELGDLLFAWQVVKSVKSNAILLAYNKATVGIGAGQMSRVDATRIAIEKAGDRARGAVLASDAFFPFGDSVELAVSAGISAIIQPGGSVKDQEIIKLCNRLKIPMVFTGRRHFKH